jgi:ferrous iron transport protein A
MNMPLLLAKAKEFYTIKKVGGKDDARTFLASLGFTVGSDVCLISRTAGGAIVNVKDSRVAISREMAAKIVVEPKVG